MSKIDGGGAAFHDNGMTLREWYAGQAMARLIPHYPIDDTRLALEFVKKCAPQIAASAFYLADQMIVHIQDEELT